MRPIDLADFHDVLDDSGKPYTFERQFEDLVSAGAEYPLGKKIERISTLCEVFVPKSRGTNSFKEIMADRIWTRPPFRREMHPSGVFTTPMTMYFPYGGYIFSGDYQLRGSVEPLIPLMAGKQRPFLQAIPQPKLVYWALTEYYHGSDQAEIQSSAGMGATSVPATVQEPPSFRWIRKIPLEMQAKKSKKKAKILGALAKEFSTEEKAFEFIQYHIYKWF